MEIKITYELLEEIYGLTSCSVLPEKKCRGLRALNGKLMIFTGSISSYNDGIITVWGYEVITLENYQGDIEPMYYNEHHSGVNKGNRERGYPGMKFEYRGNVFVILSPEYSFLPLNIKAEQLTIFN